MSVLTKMREQPSLDHYRSSTDSFLKMLVDEIKENPDYDRITLLLNAANNRMHTGQETPFVHSIVEEITKNRNINSQWPETAQDAGEMISRLLSAYQRDHGGNNPEIEEEMPKEIKEPKKLSINKKNDINIGH